MYALQIIFINVLGCISVRQKQGYTKKNRKLNAFTFKNLPSTLKEQQMIYQDT